MIKIFTTNKNGKIELDAKELKELLDDHAFQRSGIEGELTNKCPRSRFQKRLKTI